jgi:hypothetical protein
MADRGTVGPVERVRPGESSGERTTLEEMLDFLRATVVHKTVGLTDDQAGACPVPSSELTVAGLVKHLSGTERFWFSIDFAALDVPEPWPDDDPHGNFRLDPGDTLVALVDEYRAECARSRVAVAGASLDDVARSAGMAFNLRFALTHMIEETARHCGHLDILREAIDGSRGQ